MLVHVDTCHRWMLHTHPCVCQNGYISYDSVERLQIGNARSYLTTQFPTGMHADTVFLAESTVASVLATMEEAVATDGWMNATVSHVMWACDEGM